MKQTILLVLLTAFLLSASASIVFGASTSTTPPTSTDIAQPPVTLTFTTVVTGIGAGLIVGLIYAVIGFAAAPIGEDFDFAKFGLSLIVGSIVGLVASFMHTDFNSAFNLLALFGVTAAIQKFYNIALKKIAPSHLPVAGRART